MPSALRLAPALLCCAFACGTPVLNVQLTLVTRTCTTGTGDLSHDPGQGVVALRFHLTGDGLTASDTDAPWASGGAQIPAVPVGTNRRITVSACLDAGCSRVRARADSGRFDATGSDDLHLTLFLRVIDAFTPTSAPAGGACTRMVSPRAGHAMALLPDGRVLVTGGFSLDAGGRLQYRSDAEIFDPGTGSFSATASNATLARSGHAALPVLLSGTTQAIVLAGGEGFGTGATGSAVGPLELFAGGAWLPLVQPLAGAPAREHAATAVDLRTGKVVIAGGQSGPNSSANPPSFFDTVSWFDPQAQEYRLANDVLPGPTSDAVAVARANVVGGVQKGGIMLVGGRDATGNALSRVAGVLWIDQNHDFVRDSTLETVHLPTPRLQHGALRLKDDTVLVVGGATQVSPVGADYAGATDAVSIIDATAGAATDVARLGVARADACTVRLDDNSVLAAGGAFLDPAGQSESSSQSEIIVPQGASTSVRPLKGPIGDTGAAALRDRRHRAACLVLKDGSVLVTGGLQYPLPNTGAPIVAIDSAEIYTPVGAAVTP